MPTTIVKNIPVGLSDEELQSQISAKTAERIIKVEQDSQKLEATITWEVQTNRARASGAPAVFWLSPEREIDFARFQ
ncbi:hypothetical protein ACKJSM_28445 [Pseudomonas sp. PHC1]|uniref:hypothetical protein n=1 Tax=Pseudomonas sp. PHC1 TaxID=3384759 RepID=UPI00396F62BF